MRENEGLVRLVAGSFRWLLLLAGLTCLAGGAVSSYPAFSATTLQTQAARALPVATLERELAARVTKVPELAFVRGICESLGVRCWLFGGTAAGYGHYVKWDLLREAGVAEFHDNRFDYDYTNIYHSSQDADLVVDGPEDAAKLLEAKLQETYPHLQGDKSAWEVRLLQTARGDKEPLLRNPDFLNQHTDSNSTGMIEITRPPPGESAVRDLRDWTPAGDKPPQFLRDIHEGKLHYYFSDLHGTTSRFIKGRNPPILSAIRYLTKAFQYELEVRPEDWAKIRQVIADFDPARLSRSDDYVRGWIEKNGRKLFRNATNVEYAWNQLEELGLRSKLMKFGDVEREGSLAWWMNKEPLRSFELGRGPGKTAAELGITGVAHDTQDFAAYESITRAATGAPNVFSSRRGAAGEAAFHGDGFYTSPGEHGAGGSRITIRFEVNPAAREGTDFERVQTGILFKNKNALRVIPESLILNYPQYVHLLIESEEATTPNLALLENARRRMRNRVPTPAELDEVAQLFRSSNAQRTWSENILRTVLELARRTNSDQLFDAVVEKALLRGNGSAGRASAFYHDLLEEIFPRGSQPVASRLRALRRLVESCGFRECDRLLDRQVLDRLGDARLVKDPNAFELLNLLGRRLERFLAHPEHYSAAGYDFGALEKTFDKLLAAGWTGHSRIDEVKESVTRGFLARLEAELARARSWNNAAAIRVPQAIARDPRLQALVPRTLENAPGLGFQLLAKSGQPLSWDQAEELISRSGALVSADEQALLRDWVANPRLGSEARHDPRVLQRIERWGAGPVATGSDLITYALPSANWAGTAELVPLVRRLLNNGLIANAGERIFREVLSLEAWAELPEIEALLRDPAVQKRHGLAMFHALASEAWAQKPATLELVGQLLRTLPDADRAIAQTLLASPAWIRRPEALELLQTILRRGDPSALRLVRESLQAQRSLYAQSHPQLATALANDPETALAALQKMADKGRLASTQNIPMGTAKRLLRESCVGRWMRRAL